VGGGTISISPFSITNLNEQRVTILHNNAARRNKNGQWGKQFFCSYNKVSLKQKQFDAIKTIKTYCLNIYIIFYIMYNI
jgi:hypothetical protein